MADSSLKRLFEQAAGYFVETVALVRPEQWDQPALGKWSIRDLVGHTSRSLLTVEAYSAQPAEAVEVATPTTYFQKALASIGDPAQVTQRGRQAGAALGADPSAAVREIAERVLALVTRMDEAQLLGTPVGGMRLSAYLPTRTFELVVHTLDLAAALGTAVRPPRDPLAAALALAADLAAESGQGAEALLALTGRRTLPTGFSVV